MSIRKASNLAASAQLAGGVSGGAGALLWEWNGTDITQFGNGSGTPTSEWGTAGGTLAVGAPSSPGIDVPSGNVLKYTSEGVANGLAHFIINDLPTLPERFIFRGRLGPRQTNVGAGLVFAYQDSTHYLALRRNSSDVAKIFCGNNYNGVISDGCSSVAVFSGDHDGNAGCVFETDCMLREPDTGVDPQVNFFATCAVGGIEVYGGGGSWSTFGSSTAPFHSSWQSGGTIRQPGVMFDDRTGSGDTTWVSELQILSHPWTNEA